MKKQQNLDHGTWDAVTSGAVEIVDRAHMKSRIERGDRLRVKLGLDPTKPDIHLGHTVPLRALRRYQQHGHQAVLIIGDWTARIGDPSGQNVTRPQLTKEEVDAAAQTYLDQAWKILDEGETEVRFQSEWFDKMQLEAVVQLTSRYTVARMLARDDFAKRMKEGRPVGLHELLYPLLQAYDSVAVRSDLELGGTDQTFNLLVGRDLQERLGQGQRPQIALTLPLLEGLDGVQKMSQSLGNYVGITEAPDDMFGKLMSIPDTLMVKYFQLVTDLSPWQVDEIEEALESGKLHPAEAKRRLAWEIVRMYHGEAAADGAWQRFDRVFKDRRMPAAAEIPEREIPSECVGDGAIVWVPGLLHCLGLAKSNSEARRLIAQGGVRLDGTPIDGEELAVPALEGRVLQVGRRNFVRLV